MAAIYADAAAFGFKVLSEETTNWNKEPESSRANQVKENTLLLKNPESIEDFIVIAEFSEVTGPIPLLTIPPNIARSKAFDINHFIMKIMSVDYQANPGGHFQTCEDVQVLTCEQSLSAYVHYTMLHDLQARGWVRPFCIAYISSDSNRLLKNFDSLREMFLQITQILKYNNCCWFKQEIVKGLDTLRENQLKYFNYKQREVDGHSLSLEESRAMEKIDIDLLVHQYTEYQHMQHEVEHSLNANYGANHQSTINVWKESLLLAEIKIPQVACYLRHLGNKEDISNETLKEHSLRAIIALCPWGFAAALWNLLVILKSPCLLTLERELALISSEKNCANKMKFVDNALQSTEYLNLLVAHHQSSEPLILDSSDTTCDAAMFSSANDATCSSSYHSMAESLSDLPKDLDQLGDNESYLDISETFHTDDSDDSSEDEDCQESICYWKTDLHIDQKVTPGHRLLKFFCKFDNVACPIIYSLLIGRTVIISANESSRKKVSRLLATLTPLVPVSRSRPLNKLVWHCGILVSSHINSHQIIGLCVPERLSIHDMISPADKNKITILDIDSKQFFGPAYSGHLLSSLSKLLASATDDHSLQLYMQFVASRIDERVFVYKTLLAERLQDKPSTILKDLKLQGCDSEIVKFFLASSK